MTTHSNIENLIKDIREIAEKKHVILDEEQLHIGGERAVMSPHKFVLTGRQKDTGLRVVFKCAKHQRGIDEMESEHKIRLDLESMPFAQQNIPLPNELFSDMVGKYMVIITEFIDQEKVFVNHTISEQFFMALQGLEIQESFHATTRENRSKVTDTFERRSPEYYLKNFKEFVVNISEVNPEYEEVVTSAEAFFRKNLSFLEIFDGYLMHQDFAPHNFRTLGRQLVFLDYSSFTFGNKYESWARLINYMEVHNPQLVDPLTSYVKSDRGDAEYLDLRLMRVYKIGFLLNFYARTFRETEGNIHKLAEIRLIFWSAALKSVLEDIPVNQKDRLDYITARDPLRSEKEKRRQREFTNA
jgi:hypothetical protein